MNVIKKKLTKFEGCSWFIVRCWKHHELSKKFNVQIIRFHHIHENLIPGEKSSNNFLAYYNRNVNGSINIACKKNTLKCSDCGGPMA